MNIQVIAILCTILLAICGYIATYINTYIAERRKEKLLFINKQISSFYGPLYIATKISHTAHITLVTKLERKIGQNIDAPPLNDIELAEWRLWVIDVFMPINLWCEKLLIENAYLLHEKELPDCILNFITHISVYKTIVSKWKSGDFSEHFSIIDFPKDLNDYANLAYAKLKQEQLKLIGRF